MNLFSNSSDLLLKMWIFIEPSHNCLVPLLTNRTMKTKQHTQKIKNLIPTQSVLMSDMNSLIAHVKIQRGVVDPGVNFMHALVQTPSNPPFIRPEANILSNFHQAGPILNKFVHDFL